MSGLALEEYSLLEDPKYRAYVAGIDKSLKYFESTNDWADLISALGRLHKVLLSNVKYPVVPRRIVISKRLAQCLHPALPSGVHLKALEIYDIIFKCMGTKRLAQELFIYSAGLFPLFGSAAMNVRSALLTMYEAHFVPLGSRLNPGLNGFLSAVLAGLEEGSDHHEKTSVLLKSVSKGVGYPYFFGCLWECILNNSAVRLPAILYITSSFNRKYSTEDQLDILGTNIDVMVSAMCKALEDNSIMVQRAALDLVHVIFPMHNRQLLKNDLTVIVSSSLLVLLRRDMSLNRRLFTWLLGTEVKLSLLPSEHPVIKSLSSSDANFCLEDYDDNCIKYFDIFSKPVLLNAYRSLLKNAICSSNLPDLKPCKILSPLLDKSEVGSKILDVLLIDFLRYLYHITEETININESNSRRSSQIDSDLSASKNEELDRTLTSINKSAQIVFSSLEPGYTWKRLLICLNEICELIKTREHEPQDDTVVGIVGSSVTSITELCILIKFLLDLLLDSQLQIYGANLCVVLSQITSLFTENIDHFSAEELFYGFDVCKTIIKKLIPTIINPIEEEKANKHCVVRSVISHAFSQYKTSNTNRNGIVQIGIEAKEPIDQGKELSRMKSTSLDEINKQKSGLISEVDHKSLSQEVLHTDPIDVKRPKSSSNVSTPKTRSNVSSPKSGSNISSSDSFETDIEHDAFFECNEESSTSSNLTYNTERSRPFLSKYIPEFLELYSLYIKRRVILSKELNLNKFEKLLSCSLSDSADSNLVFLLNQTIKSSISTDKPESVNPYVDFEALSNNSLLNILSSTELDVFKISCSILIDLSSLPVNTRAASLTTLQDEEDSLPTWLLCLLVCITSGSQVSPEFSQSAISTLMELLALSQSELSLWQVALKKQDDCEDGTTSLCMLPLLTPIYSRHLLHRTNIYQFIATELWNHLGLQKKEYHVTSTELLLQLNGLCSSKTPSDGISVVEKELLKTLIIPTNQFGEKNLKRQIRNKGSICKWVTLWQVSRSISRNNISPQNSFNKCLFLMIERLQCPYALERSYAQNWLAESLYWSDLRRILDPLLVFLLHPDTRRVSVQHVSIEKLSNKSHSSDNINDSIEAQIYAISSTGGDIIYHVSKSLRKRGSVDPSVTKKQIITYTGINKDPNKFVTQKAFITDYEVPDYSRSGTSMLLMVNPFNQHPWIEMSDLTSINHINVEPPSSKGALNLTAAAKNAQSIKNEFSKASKTLVTIEDFMKGIINEMIDEAICQSYSKSEGTSSMSSASDPNLCRETSLHPLHSHMLLYMQLIDSGQCLYGLNLIKNILDSQPKLFLLSLASTAVAQNESNPLLLVLLARHRKSVFGETFEGGNIEEFIGQYRSMMYLQVIITICLYFIRSYYPQQPHLHVEEIHLQENRELQVVAAEVMCKLFNQLTSLVSDSPRGFSPYIKDLLNKCKVQKCVLHCLLSTGHAMKECQGEESTGPRSFTQDVLEYNFSSDQVVQSVAQEQPYLFCLMDLTLSLIKLEHMLIKTENDSGQKDLNSGQKEQNVDGKLTAVRYIIGLPIPSQPMFISSLLLALSQKNLRQFHTSWLHLFKSTLPHMGKSLPENCLKIVSILCQILDDLPKETDSSSSPSDYVLYMLSSLTSITHYCLLDNNSSSISSAVASSINISSGSTSQSSGHIFYNLLHVFSPANEILEATADNTTIDPLAIARKTLLSHLPRLVSSLLGLWIITSKKSDSWPQIFGNANSVRQQIIELLSPICHHHTTYLLTALSVVWQGLKSDDTLLGSSPLKQNVYHHSLWNNSPEQASLVELLSTMRILPLHSVVENVKEVFKHPPVIEGMPKKFPLEVSLLQLFFLYVKKTASPSQLAMCWSPLLTLVKEGLLFLPPMALLILLGTFNEFVQRAPTPQGKKEIKEQQDMATKLLEAVSNIAGSKLENTAWLRKNLTVKEDDNNDRSEISNVNVVALSVLAELLAPMLDVLYSSEEKERVVPILINIMGNVIPYMRFHKESNMAAFHSCSHLLSSLSGYQYTLKAWKKDVMEVLLDPNAFRMMPQTLPYWRTLIDNLCTHDKTVFKDLLGKMSLSQSGSLNLFANKEQEYENYAGLLKRLSFVIFCSDTDQYLKNIPDIQERLTEVTRMGQIVPVLVAQVLLCFRVLLLRISSKGMASLWPIVITELVQVFLMMEQELCTDSDQFKAHLKHMSTLDSRWVVGTYNGLHAHNNPAWLSLYLAACKLLDTMLALPASHLPQFQMYRWAFVGPLNQISMEQKKISNVNSHKSDGCDFIPHVTRIAKLMALKVSKSTPVSSLDLSIKTPLGTPLLKMNSVDTLMDLHPFMYTLTGSSRYLATPDTPPPHKVNKSINDLKTSLAPIEPIVETDFVELIK